MPQHAYQLKITLAGIRPPIWRRILVSGDTSLKALHEIVQLVMGWNDSHLYRFEVDGTMYEDPKNDEFEGDSRPAARAKLATVLRTPRARFSYLYDFGDCWKHTIVVEKILAENRKGIHAACLAGRRACPPEDCGGVPSYVELVEAVRNPGHLEHKAWLDWVGGEFDPEAFDLNAVNRALGLPGSSPEEPLPGNIIPFPKSRAD